MRKPTPHTHKGENESSTEKALMKKGSYRSYHGEGRGKGRGRPPPKRKEGCTNGTSVLRKGRKELKI